MSFFVNLPNEIIQNILTKYLEVNEYKKTTFNEIANLGMVDKRLNELANSFFQELYKLIKQCGSNYHQLHTPNANLSPYQQIIVAYNTQKNAAKASIIFLKDIASVCEDKEFAFGETPDKLSVEIIDRFAQESLHLKASTNNFQNVRVIKLENEAQIDLDAIWKNPNLKTITELRKVCMYLPPEIKHLSHLTSLSIFNCVSLATDIGYLTNLRMLELHRCSITYLPDEMKNFKNLEHLLIKEAQILDIVQICALTSLKSLHLECNYIETIPKEISQLSQLTSIKFKMESNLRDIDALCTLEKLSTLEISFGKFEAIPSQIGLLKDLTNLDISCEELREISALSQLTKLTSFNIYTWYDSFKAKLKMDAKERHFIQSHDLPLP